MHYRKMTSAELIDVVESFFGEIIDTMKQKNHDYTEGSDDPFANFRMAEQEGVDPMRGLMIRVGDKIQRIRTFLSKGVLKVAGESVKDAFMDVAAYMALQFGMYLERTGKINEYLGRPDPEPDEMADAFRYTTGPDPRPKPWEPVLPDLKETEGPPERDDRRDTRFGILGIVSNIASVVVAYKYALLREVVRELYTAAHWKTNTLTAHEQTKLWEDVRNAAGIEPGSAPRPTPPQDEWFTIDHGELIFGEPAKIGPEKNGAMMPFRIRDVEGIVRTIIRARSGDGTPTEPFEYEYFDAQNGEYFSIGDMVAWAEYKS